MLRIERNFRFSRLNFFAGLLGIYRLNKDVISLAGPVAGTFVRSSVDGSQGLALSGTAGLGYSFSVRTAFKVLLAQVLVRRDSNPDGLSRERVFTISYEYRF